MYLDHKANAARNYPPALLIPRRSENPAASCIAEPSSTMNAAMAEGGGGEEGGEGGPLGRVTSGFPGCSGRC